MGLFFLSLIFISGIFAGFVGSISGGGGLISISLLLFLGVPPQITLATNKFGGLGMGIGALYKYIKSKKIVWKYAFEVEKISLVDNTVVESFIEKELEDISTLLISSTDAQNRYKLTLNVKQGVTQKIGGAWEQYVFNHLANLNLEPRWYKETQNFVKIQLPNHVINALTGGTRFNPDIIFYNPIFLVDPKDDVNKEMYKVQAYDGYASHPEVDGNALIVSKELMGKKEAERMKDLKRTYVIDRDALNLLVNNKKYLDKDSIVKILGYGCEYGGYLNEESLLEKIDSLT